MALKAFDVLPITKRCLARFNGITKHVVYRHFKESEWRWQRKPVKMQDEVFELFKTLRVSNSSNTSDDY